MIRLLNSSPKSLVPYVLPGIIALKTALWRRQGRTEGGSLPQQMEHCWVWKVGVFLNFLKSYPLGPYLGVVTEFKCGPRFCPKVGFLASGHMFPRGKEYVKGTS